MSNRITVSDDHYAAIKKVAKASHDGDINAGAADIISKGISRKKALKNYAEKTAAGKESKPRTKKTKGDKKKKKKSKTEAPTEKTPKKKKKKKPAEATEQSTEEVSIE